MLSFLFIYSKICKLQSIYHGAWRWLKCPGRCFRIRCYLRGIPGSVFKAYASVGEPGFARDWKLILKKNVEFCIFSLFMEPADFWSDKLMLECSVSSCGKTVAPALSPERMVWVKNRISRQPLVTVQPLSIGYQGNTQYCTGILVHESLKFRNFQSPHWLRYLKLKLSLNFKIP